MNNYGKSSKSSIMTWPLGAVKRWDIFCENWSLEGELRSKGASTTQNCLENTTARILEYRTNVNGTVKWFFRGYFETIGRFSLRDF